MADGRLHFAIPRNIGVPLSEDGVAEAQQRLELRTLEREFAYEHCASVLDSHCLHVQQDDGSAHVWLDLRTAEIDVTDETKYLQARGLLDLHPTLPAVVSVRDEDEALGLNTQGLW